VGTERTIVPALEQSMLSVACWAPVQEGTFGIAASPIAAVGEAVALWKGLRPNTGRAKPVPIFGNPDRMRAQYDGGMRCHFANDLHICEYAMDVCRGVISLDDDEN